MELLRTLECLFMGELLHPQLLNSADSPEEWGFVWFVWLVFVCFCLLVSVHAGTKIFPCYLQGMLRDQQSKPEAAVTSAVPVQAQEAWDVRKTVHVQHAAGKMRQLFPSCC